MFKKSILKNNTRLVFEKIPYVRSVTVGVWIGTGSRRENEINSGVSHFVEHMLFKGTKTRTAKEIAESIDNVGGQLNAFTGKECTCIYTKTLDTHIETSLNVLSDMFFNSNYDKSDIDLERSVIVEEINMYEDSPEDIAHDLLWELSWDKDSLGYPILGTKKSLENINRKVLKEYVKDNYNPSNIVISIAGNFDEDTIYDLVQKYFGETQKDEKQDEDYKTSLFTPNKKAKEKEAEQVHLCLGFEGIPQGNDDLYTLLAVNSILGGGMSSRLFQSIREKEGLVYSIYSYPSSYKNAGLFTVYAGMKPEHLERVNYLIAEEFKTFVKDGIPADELDKAKEQLKGNYILGLESTGSRMNSIGKSELLIGKIYSPEEVLEKIDKINMETALEIIKKVFDINKKSVSVVGNLKNSTGLDDLLK